MKRMLLLCVGAILVLGLGAAAVQTDDGDHGSQGEHPSRVTADRGDAVAKSCEHVSRR